MSNMLFDTTKGDVAVNSAWLAALLAQAPIAGAFTTLSSQSTPTWGSLAAARDAITAGTTHTLAGATPLTALVNNVTVCATSADAVALPAATAALVGTDITVFNGGAAPAAVWPQLADTIDGGSAGAAVVLTNAKRCGYTCVAVNKWVSAQLGVVSA